MNEPVSLNFVLGTIGVILVVIAIGIILVNQRTKKLKKGE